MKLSVIAHPNANYCHPPGEIALHVLFPIKKAPYGALTCEPTGSGT